jgi:hypothetical protein
MIADTNTIREFLTRLGHKPAIVARKPNIDKPTDLPDMYVLWPVQIIDAPDQIAFLANYYDAVYCNLNPLAPKWQYEILPPGKSIKDSMIGRRTRTLVDIDAHDCELSVAADQRDRVRDWIKQNLDDAPLIETESGNGYGLIYACDHANDTESKNYVKEFLNMLKDEFPTVDASCFNAGRLTRVIGTFNRRNGSRVQTRITNGPDKDNQTGSAEVESAADSSAE